MGDTGAWVDGPAARVSSGSGCRSRAYPLVLAASRRLLVIAAAWGLRQLPAGRAVYATGRIARRARLAGISTRRS